MALMIRRPLSAASALSLAALLLGAAAAAEDTLATSCVEELPDAIESDVLRVLTLNASHGRGTALNQFLVGKERTYTNLDDIVELLVASEADLVALQEADGPSRWSGGFDHVAYLAGKSGYGCRVHGLHSTSRMASYGTALLARSKFLAPTSVQFQPSPPSKRKGFVSGQVRWHTNGDDRVLTIVSVHLDFLRNKTRDRQIAEMVANLNDLEGPLIILGDLNSEWVDQDSHVQRLAADLDLRAYEPGNEKLGTYKKPTGKRLDWILISRDLDFRLHKVLPDVVADHFAVYAEIEYTGKSE